MALKLGGAAGRARLTETRLGLKPDWGKLNVRKCVQERLTRSVGGSLTEARVRSLVAGRQGVGRPKPWSPSTNPSVGWGASHWAVTNVNARWPRKSEAPEAEPASVGRRQHGSSQPDRRGEPLWRGESDGTMTRTRRATGEALLVPPRKRRSKVRPITMTAGKGAEGERVAEGPAVARKVGNATGAMGPCCSAVPLATREAGVR